MISTIDDLLYEIEKEDVVREIKLDDEFKRTIYEDYYEDFNTIVIFNGRFGFAFTTLDKLIDPTIKLNGIHLVQHIIYNEIQGLPLLIHINNIKDKKRRSKLIKGLTNIGHGEFFKDKMKFIKEYFNMNSCDLRGF